MMKYVSWVKVVEYQERLARIYRFIVFPYRKGSRPWREVSP